MSKGVNKSILLGNVGKDPEIRSTNGGTLIASFSLATPDRVKDGQGNWQDKTEWHNIVTFNRTAEIVRDYVKKGDRLYLEGKIQTRSWDDKDSGQKRYRTEILAFDLTLLGARSEQNGNGNGYSRPNASYATAGKAQQDEYTDQGITDDDIPF
jgi:single-strand DNA-binding protein